MIHTTRIKVDGIKTAFYIEDRWIKTVIGVLETFDKTCEDKR